MAERLVKQYVDDGRINWDSIDPDLFTDSQIMEKRTAIRESYEAILQSINP